MATRWVGSEWSMVGVEVMLQGCLITALCDVVSEFVGSTETWSVAAAWHRGLGEECRQLSHAATAGRWLLDNLIGQTEPSASRAWRWVRLVCYCCSRQRRCQGSW